MAAAVQQAKNIILLLSSAAYTESILATAESPSLYATSSGSDKNSRIEMEKSFFFFLFHNGEKLWTRGSSFDRWAAANP